MTIHVHGEAELPLPFPPDQVTLLHVKRPGSQVRRAGAILALVVALLTMGCNAGSLAGLLVATTPTPVPTRALAPTFTPTPEALAPLIVVTPPQGGTPGVIIIQPTVEGDKIIVAIPPTDTPTPLPTTTPIPGALPTQQPPAEPGQPVSPLPVDTPAGVVPSPTPLPTDTPVPTPTYTPAPTATPFILVESGYVALRSGPGPEYPLVAQLGPGIPIAIIGRNPQGTWYEVCCVNGFSVWVAASHVRVVNQPDAVPLVVANPPPPPTPTFTPTWTPTVTPTPTATPYPFERAIGPQFFPSDNQFLTVWVKLFIGQPPLEQPAAGYCVDVKFEGFDRPNTNVDQASWDYFDWSAPQGAGNRVQYNYKYEYMPPDPKATNPNTTDTRLTLLGTGTWSVFVTDCAGNQLSDAATFTTAPSNPNREVYLGWVRVR